MPVYSCESPAERPPGARQGAGWNWEVPIGATKAAARLKLGKATIKPTTTAIKKPSCFGCGMLVAPRPGCVRHHGGIGHGASQRRDSGVTLS